MKSLKEWIKTVFLIRCWDKESYDDGYADCELKHKLRVAELRKELKDKFCFHKDLNCKICKKDYWGCCNFYLALEVIDDVFGCEKPSKDKVSVKCHMGISSVVGSQNLKDDERAETFLKSLGIILQRRLDK